ncbi:hypothetical protein GCM10010121_018490 [Streptomyces brasiliensis]|uniref:Bacterial Ig domain-containing protein n=1 Tax=Streptomyces brasiliensis TaxID=1954 RepID=A0A917NM84_9ACTN|nr:hypothetical protein GCM10010121_018490 [Streptomyces brasiliensis]
MAAGAVSVALLSAGSAGAFAASPTLSPKPTMTHSATSKPASITVKAHPTTVKAGEKVRFTGHTMGIRTGASVVLQQEKNGAWHNLHVRAAVKKANAFSLTDRPTAKGTQHFRVSHGSTHSPTVNVTVQ